MKIEITETELIGLLKELVGHVTIQGSTYEPDSLQNNGEPEYTLADLKKYGDERFGQGVSHVLDIAQQLIKEDSSISVATVEEIRHRSDIEILKKY